MKFLRLSFGLLLLCAFLITSPQAYAFSITPASSDYLLLTGTETKVPDIEDAIAAYLGTDIFELYKQDVGKPNDVGVLSGSYETSFYQTSDDPSAAIIEYVSGPTVGNPAYLLVKDGKQDPAWYFFQLNGLEDGIESWDGMETLYLNDFWPGQGAISHVSFYGTAAPVPEPATMLLLGTGLIGLAGFGRKKLIK
jgi:hypothetical protein